MDEQHDDPASEATRRGVGAAAAILGLAEALARMRYYQDDPDPATNTTDAHDRPKPDLLQQRADENRLNEAVAQTFEQARDPEWLARADLDDLGPAWAAATHREQQARAADDPAAASDAAAIREAVEERLRHTHLHLMDQYDHAVEAGLSRPDAMREAITAIYQTPATRPHAGRDRYTDRFTDPEASTDHDPTRYRGYTAIEGPAAPGETFIDNLDHQRLLTELAELGPAGQSAARRLDPGADQALAEMHDARAGQVFAQASTDLGLADNPRTPGLDEHELERDEHVRDLGRVQTDAQTGAALNGNLYSADWQGEQNNPSVSARTTDAPRQSGPPSGGRRQAAGHEARPPRTR